jgi:hypothetical protein
MADLATTIERGRDDTRGRTWAIARKIGLGALALLAVVLTARAAYYLWLAIAMVTWPHEAHNGEGTILHESQLLGQNLLGGLHTLYGPQPADGFVAGNYPPLYPLLWSLKPGPSAFPTGRGLSLLGGLIAALAGAIAVWGALPGRRAFRLAAGALGGALFLCTIPVFQQIGIAKPDMLALAFAACGLALFERATGWRGVTLAGICFGLALLTKQSIGLALAAAALAALRRGPRTLLPFLTGVGLTFGVVIGGLWLLVGNSLIEHLILYNTRPWRPDRFESLNEKFLTQHWPLLVPALGYAAWGLWRRGRSALTYYPLTALLVLGTVGAEGATRNYYIELCLAIGLGTALALGTALGARRAAPLLVGAALIVLIGFYTNRTYTSFIIGQYVPTPPVQEGGTLNELLALADAAPDPILTDSVNFLALRNRPIVIDDDFLAIIVRDKGLWNTDGIVAAVEAKRYPLVLIAKYMTDAELRRAWGDPLVEALYANYDRTGPNTFVPKRP